MCITTFQIVKSANKLLIIDYTTCNFTWLEIVKKLKDLHINCEKEKPKSKLRRDKITNEIILDKNTKIKGIPDIVSDYKLGSCLAIDWILDQYKEKNLTPTNLPTTKSKRIKKLCQNNLLQIITIN